MNLKASECRYLVVRVRKEDSAFLYSLLESEEGMTAYTTRDNDEGATYREIELCFSVDFEEDVTRFIRDLGDLVHVMGDSNALGSKSK